MFRLKLLLSLVLLTLVSVAALGQSTQPAFSSTQSIRITGLVRYADGSPANEVMVRVERFSGGGVVETRTDRLGKFVFSGLSPVQYHLTIRHPGYKEVEREVNLVFTGQEYLQLGLFPDPHAVGNKAPAASSKFVLDASIPPDARKEYEKADALLANDKKDKMVEATVHLQKAIALYPSFLEAQLKLGAVYMDLQQWDQAELALKRALEIDPKTVNAYLALGEVYLRQKKYAEAENVFSSGLLIEDRSWQGHFALARVYYAKGDISRAGKQVGLAIQLSPEFPDAHLLAANILLRANNREDARAQFEEYLRLAPKGEYAAQARLSLDKLKHQ
ncbi:MAG TPA: tetratricopeptide repeat protein [Pyrinomonadaceae bacterium]|nr:tetratricopeptide repeat protein [Pyrinomonadaceae bacterium]